MGISPLVLQGFFHLYLIGVYFAIAMKLWLKFRRGGSLLAKYFSLGFWLVGIQYLFIGLPLFLFPYDFAMVKVAAVIAWVLAFISIGCTWVAIGYIFPSFPTKLALFFLGVVGLILNFLNTYPFVPARLNSAGIMDWTHHPFIIIGGSIVFMGTFVPVGATFISKMFRERRYLRGVILGVGFIVWIIFLPLTYQVTSFGAYLFFSMLALVGATLVVVGFL